MFRILPFRPKDPKIRGDFSVISGRQADHYLTPSVKTTERTYAAFVRNERFNQAIDLPDQPQKPRLKVMQ